MIERGMVVGGEVTGAAVPVVTTPRKNITTFNGLAPHPFFRRPPPCARAPKPVIFPAASRCGSLPLHRAALHSPTVRQTHAAVPARRVPYGRSVSRVCSCGDAAVSRTTRRPLHRITHGSYRFAPPPPPPKTTIR